MKRVLFVVLGAAVLLIAALFYMRGQQDAERKLQDLRRRLEEAEAETSRLISETPANATGGAPPIGPTDLPVREPEPPAPIKEFLRKQPKQ
jgi:hypothetical protein